MGSKELDETSSKSVQIERTDWSSLHRSSKNKVVQNSEAAVGFCEEISKQFPEHSTQTSRVTKSQRIMHGKGRVFWTREIISTTT